MKTIKSFLDNGVPRVYLFANLCFYALCTWFYSYGYPGTHMVNLRFYPILASCALVAFCFLVFNRLVSLIAVRLKATKAVRVNDVVGLYLPHIIFIGLIICSAAYLRFNERFKESDAYTYFSTCLEQNEYTSTNPMNFESLLQPEVWEMFVSDSADNPSIRLSFVTCLTEGLTDRYQALFLDDYAGCHMIKIQTVDDYVLTTAESEDTAKVKPNGSYTKALVCIKGKRVVILEIYGLYDAVNTAYERLQPTVINFFHPT